jgi:hypothetical protein
MAAMQKQLVISLSDLRYVSVECANCGSSVTLDMTKESEHQKRFGFTPTACSVCQKPHDTAIPRLDDFRRAYESLLCVADRITLRGDIKTSEEEPPKKSPA